MSKYAEFDTELLRLIRNGCNTSMALTWKLDEDALEICPHSEPYRVVDRRLQYLRKKGEILYRNQRWETSLS